MLKKHLIPLLCVFTLLIQLTVPVLAEGTEVKLDLSGKAKAGYASVKVSWAPYEGAVSYKLLRGLDETDMTVIAENLTETSYTDTNVAGGNYYWYRVDVDTGSETLSSMSFRTDYAVGIEGLQRNAAIHYEFSGEDAYFDGTRTIDKTEDLEKIANLQQGTIIVRARYTGSAGTYGGQTFRTMFGIGNSTYDSTRQIVIGAREVPGYGFIARYEMCSGLYNTAMSTVPYSDGKWHTFAFTNGNAYVRTAADGINGNGSVDGCYSDTKWNGFISRGGNNLSYFTIGGFSSPNNRNFPYANWIGEIAFITITDEVLTEQQLKEVTGYFNFDVTLSLDDTNVENPADVGAIVGNFTLTGSDSQGAIYSLVEGAGNNDKFIIENGALKSAVALEEFTSYNIVVKVEKSGKEPVEFTFTITTEGDYSKPVLNMKDTISIPPVVSYPNLVKIARNFNDLTVKVKFMQTSAGIGSLIGLSNSSVNNNHFHVYVNGGTIGYELRGISGSSDIRGAVTGLRSLGLNTVAFKADSSDYTFKIFANGKLIHTNQLNGSTYRMVKDIIGGIDSFELGRTNRPSGQNSYPLTGYILGIEVYGSALSDEELIEYTAATKLDGINNVNIFEDVGSNYYRIPALYTLADNTLMAALDARFGSNADSPNNLDTAISFLRPGSDKWESRLLFRFEDYADVAGYCSSSASFIDPVIVQANDGTIYIMVDAYPSGIGTWQAKPGSGMKTVDGKKYLALTQKEKAADVWSNFDFYIKDGRIYRDDGTPTEYTVDENFYLYKNGELQYVDQKYPDGTLTGKKVPMSIFYADADFKVYSTSYLWMAYSKDNGKTWSAPRILNDLKGDNESFYGVGPGRGLVIKNGPYSGRILLPTYDNENGERTSIIYSDDNGVTWKRGSRIHPDSSNSPGKTSEAQLVELPDGTIRAYARSSTGYIGYADSYDGGVTFTPARQDLALNYVGNCMISVINYSKPIDGKPAIILSCPEGPGSRINGIIRIGLINENPEGSDEKFSVEWKYKFAINYGPFSYSCLTELPNGDIAILYETDTSTTPCTFAVYSIDELKAGMQKSYESFDIVEPDVLMPGNNFTVRLQFKDKIVQELSNLEEAYLTISYPGTVWNGERLRFSHMSDDLKSLYFTGKLPESNTGFDYEITVPDDIRVYTMMGKFVPDLSAVLQGKVGITEPQVTATLKGPDMAEIDEDYTVIFGATSDAPLTALYVTINYNSEDFEFAGINSILEGAQILAYDASIPGKVRVVIGVEGEGKEIIGAKDIFSVTLKVTRRFDLSEISAVNIEFSDGEGFVSRTEDIRKTIAMEVLVPGDINRDGIVNIGDLGMACGYYGLDSNNEAWPDARRADIDKNGKVDIADLVFIAKRILGI